MEKQEKRRFSVQSLLSSYDAGKRLVECLIECFEGFDCKAAILWFLSENQLNFACSCYVKIQTSYKAL